MRGSDGPDGTKIIKELVKGLVDDCQDIELLDLVWKLLANG